MDPTVFLVGRRVRCDILSLSVCTRIFEHVDSAEQFNLLANRGQNTKVNNLYKRCPPGVVGQ
jgi:hypothetical protein